MSPEQSFSPENSTSRLARIRKLGGAAFLATASAAAVYLESRYGVGAGVVDFLQNGVSPDFNPREGVM